jgi:hypothetical protein
MTELIQLTLPAASGAGKLPCPDGMEIRVVAVVAQGTPTTSQSFFAMAQPGAGDIVIGTDTVDPASTTRLVWTIGGDSNCYNHGTGSSNPISNSPLPDLWWPYGISVSVQLVTLGSAVVIYEMRKRT